MKNQKLILIGILIVILVAILVVVGYLAYKKDASQIPTVVNDGQNQTTSFESIGVGPVFLPLSGLNFPLLTGWQIKFESNSNATVLNYSNVQINLTVDVVKSYQDFGSGKYNTVTIKYGKAWDEVATNTIIPIGIAFDNGQYYNFVADFGNHEVSTKDYDQIWNIVKNAEPFIFGGVYQFEEFAPPNQGWMYKLTISSNGGVWRLGLNIDGFQTLTRISATANNVGNSLDVVFDAYNYSTDEANPIINHNYYKKGDVLFTLTPTSSGLVIQWKEMQPELESSLTGSTFKQILN